jgi:hypothetical protein
VSDRVLLIEHGVALALGALAAGWDAAYALGLAEAGSSRAACVEASQRFLLSSVWNMPGSLLGANAPDSRAALPRAEVGEIVVPEHERFQGIPRYAAELRLERVERLAFLPSPSQGAAE